MIEQILATLATGIGTIVSLALFVQAYKIYKRKSSGDVSFTLLIAATFSIFIWWFYGIVIKNYPLIISNTVGVIGVTLSDIMWFRYRKK